MTDVMTTYLSEAETRVTPRTLKDYRSVSNRSIVPAIGQIRAHALRRADIVQMLKRINGDRSKQIAYVLAKAALAAHVRHVDPIEHPFPPKAVPKTDKREHSPWSAKQLEQFLKAIEGNRYELLYRLALGSGLRQSEILGLRWADITDSGVVVKQKLDEYSRKLAPTKTKQSRRTVDIPDVLITALDEHRTHMRANGFSTSESSFVFLNDRGKAIIASNLRRSWRLLRERLNLPPIRSYDLRHAHATALAVAGVHPIAVSARLGHSSTTLTLETYSHVMPPMNAGALEASAALFKIKKKSAPMRKSAKPPSRTAKTTAKNEGSGAADDTLA